MNRENSHFGTHTHKAEEKANSFHTAKLLLILYYMVKLILPVTVSVTLTVTESVL